MKEQYRICENIYKWFRKIQTKKGMEEEIRQLYKIGQITIYTDA